MEGRQLGAVLACFLVSVAVAAPAHFGALRSGQGRQLLQAEEEPFFVVTPLADGGLAVQNTSFVDLYTSTNAPVTSSLADIALDGLFASDIVRGAGCLSLNVNALTGSITTAVVTADSFAAASTEAGLDLDALDVVVGSLIQSDSVQGTVALAPSTLYNLLLLGPEDYLYGDSYQRVELAYAVHPLGSAACASVAPAPTPAGAAPSPATATVPYSTSFVSQQEVLPQTQGILAGFTGATCVAFELLQEVTSSELAAANGTQLDISVFLTTPTEYEDFVNTNGVDFSTLTGICRQNNSALGSCTSVATNLNPSQEYILAAVNGLFTSPNVTTQLVAPIVVRYTAQATGTCRLTFPALPIVPGSAPAVAPTAAGPTGSPAQAPATTTPTVTSTPAAVVPTPAATNVVPTSPSPAPTTIASVVAAASPPPPAGGFTSGSTSTPTTSGSLGGFTTGPGRRRV